MDVVIVNCKEELMIVVAGHFCIKTGLVKYCSTGTSTKLVLYSSMVFFIHEVHI